MRGAVVNVWDLPVRLFHWAVLALCAFSWWSAERGGLMLKYHFWSGYALLTLVLFRILWGLFGSETARFGDFLHGPRRVLATLRELPGPRPLRVAGHNALGGWMVLALLVVLLLQAGSGLFANDDLFNEGPLYRHVGKSVSDWLTGFHHTNFTALLALVALHVLGVGWHRLRKGERLVAAMIHGRKADVGVAPRLAGNGRALLCLAAAGGLVALIVNL
jgi:cytochrome b